MTTPIPLPAPSVDAVLSGLGALPVNADDGFPQSFLLGLGASTYRFDFYVSLTEARLPADTDPRTMLDLTGGDPSAAGAQGMLVGRVLRVGADGSQVPVMRRRLLPSLLYRAADLVLVVDTLRVAAGNLNGPGAFGSMLSARVGLA